MTTQTNPIWKRGEVPAHWPDFAADREAPPVRSSLVSLADLESDEHSAAHLSETHSVQLFSEDELEGVTHGVIRVSEAELEPTRVARASGEFRRSDIASGIASELAEGDGRLALDAVTFE